MQVQEIMTSKHVATCRPENNLAEVAAAMWENRCGAVPVLDARGAVTGMITDRDIAIAAGTRNRPASQILVQDVSLPRVFTCAADSEVLSALATMATQNVRRLPVVAQDDQLVGILSIDDVLVHAEKAPGESGVSYDQVIQTAKRILLERMREHTQAPAELMAIAHA